MIKAESALALDSRAVADLRAAAAKEFGNNLQETRIVVEQAMLMTAAFVA